VLGALFSAGLALVGERLTPWGAIT